MQASDFGMLRKWTGMLLLIISLLTSCVAQTTLIEGDVYIEGIFSVQESKNDGCGDVSVSSLQHIEAVRWTLGLLNDGAAYKIGFRVHKTCDSGKRATDIAFDIALDLGDNNKSIIAIIGPEESAGAESTSRFFSALPIEKRPLQVAFSIPEAHLGDRDIYKNVFRINPSIETEILTISKFLSALNWTYVAIIHDKGKETMVDGLTSLAKTNGKVTCFPEVVAVDVDMPVEKVYNTCMNTLEAFHQRNPRISGLIVLGGEILTTQVIEAMSSLVRSTTSDYDVPVTLLAEDNPFAVDLGKYNNISKGMYRASPPVMMIQKFETYWNDFVTQEKYKQGIYNNLINCSSTNCSVIQHGINKHSVYVQYAAQGVLAIANIVKIKLNECNKSITCLKALGKYDFVKAMENTTLRFRDFNREITAEFTDLDTMWMHFRTNSWDAVFNGVSYEYVIYIRRDGARDDHSSYRKIFEYSKEQNANRTSFYEIVEYDNDVERFYPNISKPQCPDGSLCDKCPLREMAEMEITEGDIYVIGLAPLHVKSGDPLKCGPVKKGGFDVAEAIKFGVYLAKDDDSKIIPEGKIGTIIIDSCNDPQIISARILQLHNLGIYKNGKYEEVKSKILGYIGGWTSDVSITAATILTRLGYVQISYGSTSPQLSDRSKYPYFMRVVRSDILQGIKMIELVKKMGSDLLQIVYSETAYGIGGMESIVSAAEKHGICVSQSVKVEQSVNVDFDEVINKLKQPGSPKLVMVFLSATDVEKLITRFNDMKGFTFIASEEWGNRDIIARLTNLKGSITLANDLSIDERYKGHVEKISSATEKSPWLTEYMEDYFNCYHEWSFDKKSKARVCRTTDVLRPKLCYRGSDSECFKIDTWASFASVAVAALLQGARKTLDEVCNGSTQVCEAYIRNPKRLTEYIQPIRMAYDKLTIKDLFDANHDGKIDYNVYLIEVDSKGAYYEELPNDYKYNLSTCALIKNAACNTCLNKVLSQDHAKHEDGFMIAMIVFIVISGILVVAIAAMLFCWRRGLLCFKGNSPNDTYLHPAANYCEYSNPSSPTSLEADVSDGNLTPVHGETHMNFYIPDVPERCSSTSLKDKL